MKGFFSKLIVATLVGFVVVALIGRVAGRLGSLDLNVAYPWLMTELSVNPRTTLAVVIIVALICMRIMRKRKKKEEEK